LPVHDESAINGVVLHFQVEGAVDSAAVHCVGVLVGVVEFVVPVDTAIGHNFLDSSVHEEENCAPHKCSRVCLEETLRSRVVLSLADTGNEGSDRVTSVEVVGNVGHVGILNDVINNRVAEEGDHNGRRVIVSSTILEEVGDTTVGVSQGVKKLR